MVSVLERRMAIVWRLNIVMAEKGIRNQELAVLTGLHPGTISKLKNSPPERIDAQTLNSLCYALNCQPGDLMRYVPDEPGHTN